MRAQQTMVAANVEQKVTSTGAIEKICQLLEIGRSINRLDYSMNIAKLTQGMQRLSGLVDFKNLKLKTKPGLIESDSSL